MKLPFSADGGRSLVYEGRLLQLIIAMHLACVEPFTNMRSLKLKNKGYRSFSTTLFISSSLPETAQGLQITSDGNSVRTDLSHHLLLPSYRLESELIEKLTIQDTFRQGAW